MEAPRAKPLWQLGLDWLLEANGGATHPLDRERARRLARGMRMVGEHPAYRDVSEYVGELWESWAAAATMVRECWRSVYRAKTSLGRSSRGDDTPLYEADRLIEAHGLQPGTETRLAVVAREALEAVLAAAQQDDTAKYVALKRELDAALTVVDHLRLLRLGARRARLARTSKCLADQGGGNGEVCSLG